MADTDQPQIYLITPPAFELTEFVPRLSAVLDGADIACLRLSMASSDEDRVARAADSLREVAHQRDVPIVIDSHLGLVERLGLDGVHLPDGTKSVRAARKELGADAIVGSFSGTSRHDGMTAAEAGADYISFGPAGATSLGTGENADQDLFAWWTEMIEVPVVAEGGISSQLVENLAPIVDFFGLGEEIWASEDALKQLNSLIASIV